MALAPTPTADPVGDLATARTALETVGGTTIVPTTTMGDSTYTWTEMVDLIQEHWKRASGGSEDLDFHMDLIALYTELETEMSAT